MKLNRGQDEAIKHGNGPCMVLAPPGSGKTLIVTERTRYLIEESGVRPDQILVITFTRYAAREMKERFERLTAGKNYAGNVWDLSQYFLWDSKMCLWDWCE